MSVVFRLLVFCLVAAASPQPMTAVLGVQALVAQEQVAPAPQAAPSIPWTTEVAQSLRTPFARLLQSFVRVVPRLVATVLTLLVFWAIANVVGRLANAPARFVRDPTLRQLIVQFSYYIVWAIGAVAVLDALGFDPQTVVTGLGLTSIALGFALKDVVSNLVSGLLIMVMRSFQIGDQIVVGETEGTVERIEVRVTQIRTYDGRLVLVPNAEVFTSRVINNTASPIRRASIVVPIDPRQDLDQAMRTIEIATKATSGVSENPPPSVRLRDLTPEHFAIEARFWTDSRRSDFMNTSCQVRAAIVHALKEAGIEMPNPGGRVLVPGDIERWRALLDRTANGSRLALAMLAVAAATACSAPGESPSPATGAPTAMAEAPTAIASAPEAPLPETASPYDALPEAARLMIDKPFTGDFDEMVKRRVIRVAVTFNRTHYFIDEGQQRGITYESMKLFEDELNADLKTGNLRIHVAAVPMPRDQLYTALTSGNVDMVAAMVTVTPERRKLVAFSEPTRTNVSQVVVTGPGAPPLATLDDLSGQEVFIRKTSLYAESLAALNAQLKARGKPAVVLREAPEVFEDDDLLEMVNAGLAPITIVDDYLAEFWSQVFTDVVVHRDLAVRSGGELAIAMRLENPRLREVVNGWVREHSKGDAFRNTIERRYLGTGKYAKNAAAQAERKKLQAVVALFQKYGEQYKLDFLLMAAQGYQESTLDHSVKSPVGAVGIMQVMPPTGKELKVGDITLLEPNIHAGVKYMRFMMDQYFANEPMDDLNKALMTFAAYNAGPGRLRQLRREAEKRGLDPNVWFGNVERVASERIGRETVQYVSNIYKYYVAYRLSAEQIRLREAAKADVR